MQSLLNGIQVYFSHRWNRGICTFDKWTKFPFEVVHLLWPEFHLAAYKGVASFTVRTLKAACVEHTAEGSTSGIDEVQLVPAM